MLTKEQQKQYIRFIVNFVDQVHQDGMDRQSAAVTAAIASSTLLATVMCVEPGQDAALDAFVVRWLRMAIERCYGKKLHA